MCVREKRLGGKEIKVEGRKERGERDDKGGGESGGTCGGGRLSHDHHTAAEQVAATYP